MMYPYMTLNDDTEITHSEMKADGTMLSVGFLTIHGKIMDTQKQK